jgi:hypothetical protein
MGVKKKNYCMSRAKASQPDPNQKIFFLKNAKIRNVDMAATRTI